MAVQTDLSAWRAFVRRSLDPLPHERPTGLRTATTEERIASLAGDFVVETPDLSLLMKHLAVLESLALTPSSHSAGMLAVSGPPTWGKTTAGLFLARNHERRKRLGLGDTKLEDESIQPALYVVVPPATSPKMLMVAFCRALGLPHTNRQTAVDVMDMVVTVLGRLKTSLVVLDEVHNIQSNRQIGAEAASTLKQLAERVDATFILLGIDLAHSPIFAGLYGSQLAARALGYEVARKSWTVI